MTQPTNAAWTQHAACVARIQGVSCASNTLTPAEAAEHTKISSCFFREAMRCWILVSCRPILSWRSLSSMSPVACLSAAIPCCLTCSAFWPSSCFCNRIASLCKAAASSSLLHTTATALSVCSQVAHCCCEYMCVILDLKELTDPCQDLASISQLAAGGLRSTYLVTCL